MEFKVNSGTWGNMFGVPCVVADNLLKIASGAQIKVLMYILRNSGKDCSYEEISFNTGVTLQEAQDSVNFWQQANIVVPDKPAESIQLDFFSTQPPELQNVTETVPENPPEQKKIIPSESKRRHWTGTEILKLKMESSDMAELFNAVQSVLGNLNHMQCENIVNMHEDLGMSKEVIMTLIGYCKSINKTHPNYIYERAYQWAKDNIVTQEQAEKEVQRLSVCNEYKYQVMRIVKLDRLSDNQEKLIECWKNWNISLEMIEYAYQKALDNEIKIVLKYMNGIIKKWHDKGITSLKDAQKDDKLHKQESDKKNSKKEVKKDDNFDVDMYKIFINDF